MRWEDNPLYEPKRRVVLRGRARLLWRLGMVALLAGMMIIGWYIQAAIFTGIWIAVEIADLRHMRSGKD